MANRRARDDAWRTAALCAAVYNSRPYAARFVHTRDLVPAEFREEEPRGDNAAVPTRMRDLAPLFKRMIVSRWRQQQRHEKGSKNATRKRLSRKQQ